MCLFVRVLCEVRMSPANRILLLVLYVFPSIRWEKRVILFAFSSIFVCIQRLVINFLDHGNQMINYVCRLRYEKNYLGTLYDDF